MAASSFLYACRTDDIHAAEELRQVDLPSRLVDEDPTILPSAHREKKHGEPPISDTDILHVYRYGIEIGVNTQRDPPTHIIVGTGTSGAVLYEIGVIERSWIPEMREHVIVHAMRARLTYEMIWMTLQYSNGDHNGV